MTLTSSIVGFLALQVLALYVFDNKVIVEAVLKQHWQEEVAGLVTLALVSSILRKLLRLELETAVVARRKQVLAADVVVMTHFGVRGGERFFATAAVYSITLIHAEAGPRSWCCILGRPVTVV